MPGVAGRLVLSYSRDNTSANFIPQSLVQIGTDLRLDAGTYSGTGRNAITVDYDGKRNGTYGRGSSRSICA